jgi:quaternary ammonium compound-resistance protein SugE
MLTMSLLRWFYLFIAAVAEIWWTYSLKYIDMKKIFATPVKQYFIEPQNTKILAPALGYILFGVCNIFFFSLAMKEIPTSVAFTVWVAISIVGLKLMDVLVFKASSFNNADFFFYALIIIGILGLKKTV